MKFKIGKYTIILKKKRQDIDWLEYWLEFKLTIRTTKVRE